MADTVSRYFSLEEMSRITEHSIRAGINLIPYVCRECMDCLQTITNCIRAVRTYNVTPERFWNGDRDDYSYLILLLSSDYPSKELLLQTALEKRKGEITGIAHKYYQHVVAMMDYVKDHAGYVVLKPSEYMCHIYPEQKDKFFVYTRDIWIHCKGTDINKPVMILTEEELCTLSERLNRYCLRGGKEV